MSAVEVSTAVDDRFRFRSVYWRPGMSVLVEPWAVLAETNTGHLVVPAGRNEDYARAMLERWWLLAGAHRPISGPHVAVSGVLVAPDGSVDTSWALDGAPLPVPGGAPRWSPLVRVTQTRVCEHCEQVRWPGTWVGLAVAGCVECLPEREQGDPRPCWPREAPRPPGASAKRPKVRKVDAVGDEAVTSLADLAQVDTPDPDRLF